MTLPVFLVESLEGVVSGTTVHLGGDEGRHAVVVKRLRAGEEVLLCDGRGTKARCEIDQTQKASFDATALEVGTEGAPTPRITVVQAIPKGERGELAVEVLTEVGVDRIVPWAAHRCVAVWRGERAAKSLTRWRNAARESAKQARRSWLPEVTEMASTQEVAGLVEDADLVVVLHEEATTNLASLAVETAQDIVVVVGPEGGLTDEEIEAFGVPAVRLGDTVLRTSTAGVAAVSALLARTERWA